MIVGPRPSRALGQKLLVALGACGAFSLVLLLALMTLPDNFESSTLEWIIVALSGGLIVFLLTAWAVVCSHVGCNEHRELHRLIRQTHRIRFTSPLGAIRPSAYRHPTSGSIRVSRRVQ